MQYKIVFTVGLLAMMDLVAGHGAIIGATGDAGGSGTAIGSKCPYMLREEAWR